MARAQKPKKAPPSRKPTKAKPTKAATTKKPTKAAAPSRKKSGGNRSGKAQRATAREKATRSRPVPAKPLTPAQKAAATRAKKAAQKAAKVERQRERRREQREAAKMAARESSRARDERDELTDVMEEMTPVGFSLELVEPEIAARTPWTVVGKFWPQGEISYAELGAVFSDWAADLLLEARINPQRVASIRVVYQDPSDKRGSGDSVVSHTGPWELVVSEMAAEMNPDLPDSLAARYAATLVPYFYVYFSTALARSSSWIPHYQRD